MRNLTCGLGAVIIALTGAGAASADPLNFARFQSYCLARPGNAQAAIAAAVSDGWSLSPRTMTADIKIEPMEIGSQVLVRMEQDTSGSVPLSLLMVGPGFISLWGFDLKMTLCTLGVSAPADENLLHGAEAWAGGAESESYPDLTRIFLFTQDASGRHVIRYEEAARYLERPNPRTVIYVMITQRAGYVGDGATASFGVINNINGRPTFIGN